MALRAFHSNPCIGGFGNESASSGTDSTGDCDAFAQIVKELVDNAVDACGGGAKSQKRVRVTFDKVCGTEDILKVTVTDNGCGMEDIDACVQAFKSQKHARGNTAGRYGIGLTLCLLHAQRLVPGSKAMITSATPKTERVFHRNVYVVDVSQGDVKCIKRDTIPKNTASESGTAVSLSVPGGETASRAWPRLAEYFARFELSLGLPCSLEVMAPTLSKVPLFVRSEFERLQKFERQRQQRNEQDDSEWGGTIPDGDSIHSDGETEENVGAQIKRRQEILVAVSSYLKQTIQLKNVAHSTQIVRRQNTSGRGRDRKLPTLEVDLIIHPGSTNDDQGAFEDTNDSDELQTPPGGRLILVRMVNRVPLLDGAEAAACGLVAGLTKTQSMWTSFGLSVQSSQERCRDRLFVPTYSVRDSEHVAPFLQQNNTHPLYQPSGNMTFEDQPENSGDELGDLLGDNEDVRVAKRKEQEQAMAREGSLLPANLRLGNITMIVQIHANPSSLPLPTLSKSRLPMNEEAIFNSFEAGMMECLRSLQKTNPGLLLTPQQLRGLIRDAKYIPSAATAIASIVGKSRNETFRSSILQSTKCWSLREAENYREDQNSRCTDLHVISPEMFGKRLENILRLRCVESQKPKRPKQTTTGAKRRRDQPRPSFDSIDFSHTLPSPLKTYPPQLTPQHSYASGVDSIATSGEDSPTKKSRAEQ